MSDLRGLLPLKRALLLAVVLSWLAAGPVQADHEPARLGLTPVGEDGTYFEITMEPGDRRELRVEAANFGHEETLARAYAADVYSIVNGGFGADLFGERPSGTTTWVSFPTQELMLGPQDAVVIDVEVEVPDGTAPGEYVTALVIENAEPVRGSGTIAVDQVNRSAIAVAIDVPGARRPGLEIGKVRHQEVAGASVVSFEVRNTGNVHLRPAGHFALRDLAGREITASAVAMDSVFAGTSTTLEAPASERLRPGDYCAELTLTDEETTATAASGCLPITIVAPAGEGSPIDLPGFPPVADAIASSGSLLSVLIGLLALGGMIVLLVIRRRRNRRSATAGVPDGATVRGPVIDLPDRREPMDAVLASVLGALRRVLHEHPRVSRAWILERDSGFLLAFEGTAGMSAGEEAQLSRMLQERADQEVGSTMPMLVVSVSGSDHVARTAGDSVPFYVSETPG